MLSSLGLMQSGSIWERGREDEGERRKELQVPQDAGAFFPFYKPPCKHGSGHAAPPAGCFVLVQEQFPGDSFSF